MSFNFNEETPEEHTVMNKNYALDTAETLQYTRRLLKVIGIWPMVKLNPKRWEIYVGKSLIVMGFALMSFIEIPLSVHTICIEKITLVKILMYIPMSYCLANILKYSSMIHRCEALKLCMEHVKIDWMAIETEHDRGIMMHYVKVGRRITLLSGSFLCIGGLSYHAILPLSRGSEINEFNKTIRPLAYPGYDIFFDTKTSSTHGIVFGLINISCCALVTVTTTACNLAVSFVTHLIGQTKIIASRFETFFEKIDETDKIRQSRIEFVIKSHVRVLRLTSMIETLLCEICFVEVGTSIIMICLLEYSCLMVLDVFNANIFQALWILLIRAFIFLNYSLETWNDSETVAVFTYVVLFASATMNVFVICYIGELLKGQCARIGDVAYMMGWDRLPGKTGLALIMIIAMSNCPRKLTAGRIIELSVYSFGSIMRTSMAYLNMLRRIAV